MNASTVRTIRPDVQVELAEQPRLLVAAFRMLCDDTASLRMFAPVLSPGHWPEFRQRWLVALLVDYFGEYDRAPGMSVIRVLRESDRKVTDEQRQQLDAFIDELSAVAPDESARPFLRNEFEHHAMRRAVTFQLREAETCLRSGDQDGADAALAAMKHCRVDKAEWLTLPDDADKFFTHFNHEDLARFSCPTGLPSLDGRLGGGLREGELGVWLAPLGSGKSMALVHCGAAAYSAGRTVLHVTFENSTAETLARYTANLLAIDREELIALGRDHVRVNDAMARLAVGGQLFIKELIGSRTSASDIEQLIARLGDDGHKPGLVAVDYADLMNSAATAFGPRYEEMQTVFQELREVAARRGVPIWTATQTNREGLTSRRVRLDQVADSIGKMRVADVVISISPARDLHPQRVGATPRDDLATTNGDGRRVLSILKLRRGIQGDEVTVGARFAQAKFVELDGPEAEGEDDDA